MKHFYFYAMKNLIITLSFVALFNTVATAQDSATIRRTILALIEDGKNEFVLTKDTVRSDTGAKYTRYATKRRLGKGDNSVYVYKKDDTKRFYVDYFLDYDDEYESGTTAVKAAKSIITEWRKTRKYTAGMYYDYDSLGSDIEITYLRDLEGNYIMEIEQGYDFYAISIYSKKWGKK